MQTSTAENRLDVIEDLASKTERSRLLIVFLPGAYDKPQDFVDHGFIRALRNRHVAADVLMVNMHVGYYTADQTVERLREDIVLPARQNGYAHIWLVGISLGGYGALLYSRLHASNISGLFLMAPFMGNRSLLAEIAKAGLTDWTVGKIEPADEDRALWSWLQGYNRTNQFDRPPLYIGYGSEDRFADSNRTLAQVLPAHRVILTDGGHEWAQWRRLWFAFLDCAALPPDV